MRLWKITVLVVLTLVLWAIVWAKQNPAQFDEIKWSLGIFMKHLKVEAQMPLSDSYRKMMPTLFKEIDQCDVTEDSP